MNNKGGSYFCNSALNCKSLDKRDFYKEYRDAGFTVVNTRGELNAYNGQGPIVGIFNSGNMDTWIDRNIYTQSLNDEGDALGKDAPAKDQPGLEEMTMAAVRVLETRCQDGFFLMVEAASVDKAMHLIDYDRALGELLELDRTVKLVNGWRVQNSHKGETAIIVTSDHAQAFDVVGVVDTEYLAELPNEDNIQGMTLTGKQADLQYFKRKALGNYDYAGWPDLVTDSTGMPTNWEGRYRLWNGKVDSLQHKEDFKIKKQYRKAVIKDERLSKGFGNDVYVMNPEENGVYHNPTGYSNSGKTVHSLQAVDLYCAGPIEFTAKCAKVMDNTELFFIMANALGLGSEPTSSVIVQDYSKTSSTIDVQTIETVYTAPPSMKTVEVYRRNSATQNMLSKWYNAWMLFACFYLV